MPDLIRHPEHNEALDFGLRQNDALKVFRLFTELSI